MDENIAISFKNVTKRYRLYKTDKHRFLALFFRKRIPHKTITAINNVSFTIKKGESVAIIGRNGAGKSTILKLISGVSYPSKGKIKVNGQVAALLELTAGFDSEMTGRENIYLKGLVLGLLEEEIRNKEKDIIAFADIGEYIDQPVRTYSSGMKARLGFSVNVNIDPDVLIVDEALSVGDAKFRKKCENKVKTIVKNGATVLFVSHSIPAVKNFCTKAIYLEEGKIVASGSVEEVVRQYEDSIK